MSSINSFNIGLPSIETYKLYTDEHPENNKQLRGFLNVVFRQVDTDRFMTIYNDTVKNATSSEEVYSKLLQRSGESKGHIFKRLSRGLNALKLEKATLEESITKVMDVQATRKGYVEIGMPGRMVSSMSSLANVKGKKIVVNEEESLIQSGFPKPYNEFQKLTYDPLNIPKESVDVVSCFAGLHHCPEEKMDAFVESIRNSLTEGGVFLLREHDTDNPEMERLAGIVHSVFNCNTGVSLENEKAEVRNFKSVKQWIELLERHGFKLVSNPLIREGDTSKNALLKFVKVSNPNSDEGQKTILREQLRSEQKNYTRGMEGGFLNRVEWLNVDSSKNLGKVKNFWSYPYFKEIGRFFSTYRNAIKASSKSIGFWNTVTSEKFMVNTFIYLITSGEYLLKGLAYAPINFAAKCAKILPKAKSDENWEKPAKMYQKWMQEYGKKLDTIPFYDQKYVEHISPYWKELKNSWNASRKAGRSVLDLTFDRQTVKNILTGIVMSVDMLFRAAVATVVNYNQGGAELGDERTIGLIVKGKYVQKEGDGVVKIIREEGEYQAIIANRYKDLEALLKEIANQGLEVVEIAGQNEILVEYHSDKNNNENQGQKLYSITSLEDPSKDYKVFKVPVNQLNDYVNKEDLHRVYDY